jgi:hypothetical protein
VRYDTIKRSDDRMDRIRSVFSLAATAGFAGPKAVPAPPPAPHVTLHMGSDDDSDGGRSGVRSGINTATRAAMAADAVARMDASRVAERAGPHSHSRGFPQTPNVQRFASILNQIPVEEGMRGIAQYAKDRHEAVRRSRAGSRPMLLNDVVSDVPGPA